MYIVKRFGVCLVFILLIELCKAENLNLCALNKVDNKCWCEYKTCEVTHFPELYADCRWIELQDFPQSTTLPQDVKHLDLSHNNIATLRKDYSSDILIELLLSYNELNYIDYGFFENLSNLKILDLSHNSFQKLDSDAFTGLSHLTTIDLSYNQLITLPENLFTPIKTLDILKLGYNNLGNFFETITNVYEADFDLSKNISSLSLNNLNLTKISNTFFGDVANLKHLNMADNVFSDIPPIPTSITNLDISGNNITILSVKQLRYSNLKVLHLKRMKNLEIIDDYAFYNMKNLEELYIQNCPKLKRLNDLAFGVIRPNPDDLKLKRISLAGNGLERINKTYLRLFNTLDYIDLQDNPWICDCGVNWMQTFSAFFYKSGNIRCAQPSNLKDKKITELTKDDLPDCSVSSHIFQLRKVLIPILAAIIMFLMIVVVLQIYFGPYAHNKYRNIKREPTSPTFRSESPERRDSTYVY